MSASRPAPPKIRGFTLVELMVVISVIGILASITVSAAMKVRQTMRVRVARASASRLAQAIEAYEALMNFLPVQNVYDAETDGDDIYENWDLIAQIQGVMSRDPLLKHEASELNAAGSFKDSWGRPFRVVMWKEGDLVKYFQVYSCGENRLWEVGNGDDLVPRG